MYLLTYLSWSAVFTLDVGGLTSVSLRKQSKLVITSWYMRNNSQIYEINVANIVNLFIYFSPSVC